MPSVNHVEIIGHLGGDPKIMTMASGHKVANFSIATGEKWKDKNSGEWQEKTEWHRVVAWRWMAERAERDLKKGSLCRVTGKIVTRMWEKDGEKHYATEIVADTVMCFDKKPKREEADPATDSGAPEGYATGTINEDGSISPDAEDLPFS